MLTSCDSRQRRVGHRGGGALLCHEIFVFIFQIFLKKNHTIKLDFIWGSKPEPDFEEKNRREEGDGGEEPEDEGKE